MERLSVANASLSAMVCAEGKRVSEIALVWKISELAAYQANQTHPKGNTGGHEKPLPDLNQTQMATAKVSPIGNALLPMIVDPASSALARAFFRRPNVANISSTRKSAASSRCRGSYFSANAELDGMPNTGR